MNTDLAKQLAKNVHDFYENHGPWFATTRGKIIPEQAFVSEYLRAGMTVVDVGAGNGRFANLLPTGTTYIGIEPSDALRTASKRSDMIQGSLPSLPLLDKTSDVTVCLATLHHIPTGQTRHASVEELIRITKPGGIILATSWLKNPNKHEINEVVDGEAGDMLMSWQEPETKQQGERYVHFMQPEEWNKLWIHSELEIIRIGMYGKQDWTKQETEALNWRVVARRR